MNYVWLLPVGLLLGLYWRRADFAHYSIATVGVYNRVHRYKIRDKAQAKPDCSELLCESGVDAGEKRVATKEVVIFGCPLLRRGTVSNYYCPDHASFEFRQDEYDVTTTAKVAEGFKTTLVLFSKVHLDTGDDTNTPLQNTANGVSTSFELVGVTIVVLFMAICLMPFKNEL